MAVVRLRSSNLSHCYLIEANSCFSPFIVVFFKNMKLEVKKTYRRNSNACAIIQRAITIQVSAKFETTKISTLRSVRHGNEVFH